MRKLLGIVVLGLLFSLKANAESTPKNPTNLWLDTQNVNSLTQKHGYQLVHTTASANQIAWTLTKPKSNINDGKFIVVICVSRGIEITDCWLP